MCALLWFQSDRPVLVMSAFKYVRWGKQDFMSRSVSTTAMSIFYIQPVRSSPCGLNENAKMALICQTSLSESSELQACGAVVKTSRRLQPRHPPHKPSLCVQSLGQNSGSSLSSTEECRSEGSDSGQGFHPNHQDFI